MKRTKLILTNIVVLLNISLYSFPGDHNSLTCDKNFLGLTATINGAPNTEITDINDKDPNGTEIPNTGILTKYFRKNISDLDAQGKINRANIIAAINADIAKPYDQSIVKKSIRGNIDNTFEGKPLQVTKWGDSLSDFVSFYGVLTPGALGAGVPIPPVGGVYGGSPLWINALEGK